MRKVADQPGIAVVVSAVGDVAGGEQQVGAVRLLHQHLEHLVEALAVIFGRIVRIEPDMDIGDLCDQHIRPLLRPVRPGRPKAYPPPLAACKEGVRHVTRSEEHTSELQSLMRISYAVFCLKKKKKDHITNHKYRINNEKMHTR